VTSVRSAADRYGARPRELEVLMGLVLRLAVDAAALWVAVALLDGLDFEGSAWAFLVIALILGLANVVVKPILTVLSLPLIVLTLGLFLLVVNALVLSFTLWLSDVLGIAFTSDGFGWTLAGALIISLVAWGLETLFTR
jgi:putative membrane protein